MSAAEWYYTDSGETFGPFSQEELIAKLPGLAKGDTLVFGPGMSSWTAARHVPGLGVSGEPSFAPPPPTRRADEIDYEITGDDMQFVEVELDPGEMVIAEAGAMMYMTAGVSMESKFGDPSKEDDGLLGKVFAAGKRMLTGESLFMTTFTGQGPGKQRAAFAAPYPGKIIPMDLAQLGGELLCQKNSFLCAARGVSIGVAFTKRIGAGLFGGEGFILQRLTGDGIAFVHAGGTLCHRQLKPGETLKVDTGCIVAFEPYDRIRHQVRRRHQEHALRRRGFVLRRVDGSWHSLASVVAFCAPGRPHPRHRRPPRQAHRRRQRPGRPRPHPRRRQLVVLPNPSSQSEPEAQARVVLPYAVESTTAAAP